MTRPSRRSRGSLALLAFAAFAGTTACSNSSGCSALAPLPNGQYEGTKTDNAVTVRISPHGINHLNANWQGLLDAFAPGQQLDFGIPCSKQNVAVIGDVWLADQGNASGGGRLDSTCDARDVPANVKVSIMGFSLVPRPTDTVEGRVVLRIDTGKIFLAKGCIKCSAQFKSTTAGSFSQNNSITAEITFTIDARWDKLLSFEIKQPMSGTQKCGSNPSNPSQCIDPKDLDLGNECNLVYGSCSFTNPSACGCYVCSGVCDGADWDPVKNLILDLLGPMIQDRIKDAVQDQSCRTCGTGQPLCPTFDGVTSTCQSGLCRDPGTSKCVPRFLGVEGRMAPGVMMSGFGVPLDAQLDLSLAAGSSVSVDQGINLGTRAGFNAVNVAACVPTLPAPQLQPMSVPDFDAEAPEGPYHVGVGIGTSFLDLAMFHAHQSGTLCISLSSANFGVLNTGLFKTFLPSLGRLATRDGMDAPMMVVLRPSKVPLLTVGEGTFDPVTKKPVKPLLTLAMIDLDIDFYAMIDDRFVRIFSLTADVSIPLSLIFENCSSVTPALGDLQQLITNVRTSNSEMLAEDPNVLADLIPAVIGLAEPALAGALQPFELPELGAFKLRVAATKGLTNIPGTERYEHMGLFADLMAGNAQCVTGAPKAHARLVASRIPSGDEMRLSGKPLVWPTAVLGVGALGAVGTPEYAWRVDGGIWSTFLAPGAGGELEVSHPRLLLQGRHVIEVRTRLAENPHGVSAPVKVDFLVDYEAPEVTLTADREAGVLHVRARDFVTAAERLTFAYQVGGGPVSDFGPARVVDLEAIEAQGGLEVLVKDESGNVGRAEWRAPVVALRPEQDEASGDVPARGGEAEGCSSAGGAAALWALLGGAGLAWRRRRARGS